MAKLYPNELTEAFSGYRTPSERRVYEKFGRELSGAYHVFHDFLWDDPSLDDSKTSGQIDFLIVDPSYGYIALEVKGGRCEYNPEYRSWSSIDRNEHKNSITDPFEQARAAGRVICKLLLKQPHLADIYIPHHHAVIFPDCVFKKRDIRADIHAWQLLDQESMFNLEKSISILFTQAFPKGKIPQEHGKLILSGIRRLYGDVPLKGQTPVAVRIREIAKKMIDLTDDQLQLLDSLQAHKRLLIRGCAGSGKTTLAVHKAKMLADCGMKVLLVCFNIPLSQYLRHECEACSDITVGSFHDLCFKWMEEIGRPVSIIDDNEWWSETFPNLVADHIDSIEHRFDAIIIDEGQDFKEAYRDLLEMFLVSDDDSIFYIFADANQNIYKGEMDIPMITAPVQLNRNLRNTNQVFEAVQRSCELDEKNRPSGIDGPAVEYHEYSDDGTMIETIKKILEKLVADNMTAQDIVILGTKSQKRTKLQYGTRIGPFPLVERRQNSDEILTMTVHRFKGLESPVVILCEIDEDIRYNLNEILYIGLTRSTGMLFVLCKKGMVERIQDRQGNVTTE